MRTGPELLARRAELDAILADAPPDLRHHISTLRASRPADADLDEMLQIAITGQGDRRRWILEHWPHVVEAAQVTRALADGDAAVDAEPPVHDVTDDGGVDLAGAGAGPDRRRGAVTQPAFDDSLGP